MPGVTQLRRTSNVLCQPPIIFTRNYSTLYAKLEITGCFTRNAALDRFLGTLVTDVYPEVPTEPHLSITQTTIDTLLRDGIIKPGMRVLDVGCGQGLALERFPKRDCSRSA
jgi:2-polyprenyl-3-methyl-5-hydroxy-6-metoxy-1,4-benzoquinol methylase